jgi:RNA polymerase sigma-54 factor
MAIGQRLELRQRQSLVMTPQLQQAIRLLQLSNLELTEFVEQEVEKNPFLDFADGGAPTGAGANGAEGRVESSRNSGDDVQPSDKAAANRSRGERAEDASAFYPNGARTWAEGGFDLENLASVETSLREHLHAQLQVEIHDPVERLIGAQLIEALDEAGYLTESLDELGARLGCEVARLEALLAKLQQFDPPGVFARNLRECLGLQLHERDRLDPLMQILLDHLELLAVHDLGQLKKRCGCDGEDLAEMIREIRTLDPKPGTAFRRETLALAIPDVFLKSAPGGGWLVELNSETLPKVLVNNRYYSEVAGGAKNKAESSYILNCLSSANWLVKALDQRAHTILKVATEIVRQQDGFFAHGVHHLRPLNLRAIAEAIGMHESTVSRVTANKYMATPRGILEFKYFFTAAIASSSGGEAHSAEAVRQRIRELISQEEKNGDVLSDDRLAEILLKDGIDIARRTVAKYREALGIPSSVQRRRQRHIGS